MGARWRVAVLAFVASVWIVATPLAHQDSERDALTLLAQAREALGGDAALSAVTSFSVDGSFKSGITDGTLEYDCQLPDKFVRQSGQVVGWGQFVGRVAQIDGFNSGAPINVTVSPYQPQAGLWITPSDGKAAFVQLTLAMFAASLPADPMNFSHTKNARVQLSSGPADVIAATEFDGSLWRLLLDTKTHLPAAVAQGSRRAGMVYWVRTTFTDYKRVNGINWPHRMSTGLGNLISQDVHLGTFKINPKIDPKTFTPANSSHQQ